LILIPEENIFESFITSYKNKNKNKKKKLKKSCTIFGQLNI